MRERTIIALWKRLAGGQRLRLRVVSVLVIALGSAALLVGPGIDSTARAQTTVDYDADDDGLIEVTTVAQLGAIRWDLNGDGAVDPGGDAASYGAAFPNAMVSPLMGCATTGCVGYELTANLDLVSAGDSVTGWAPIGGASNAFTATFDGGAPGFTVSNLTINSSLNRVGLFGQTGPGSVIRNVTLEDVNVTGYTSTGALVGRNAGSIIDSHATGTVSGTEDTGGLVGAIFHPGGVIVGSTAGVQVTGRALGLYIGGLAGFNSGLIIDSHATGDVDGVRWVGGLVGSNGGAGGVNWISGSTAGGAVTGTGNLVGGLVGFNDGPDQQQPCHRGREWWEVGWGACWVEQRSRGRQLDKREHRWRRRDRHRQPGGWIGRMEQRPDQQQPCHRGRGWCHICRGACWVELWSRRRQQDKREHRRRRRDRDRRPGRRLGRMEQRPDQRQPCRRGREWFRTYVGGLVGSNYGADGVNKISGSTASGAVTGTGYSDRRIGRMDQRPDQQQPRHRDREWQPDCRRLVGSSYDDDAWNGLAVGLNAITWSTASGLVEATGDFAGGLAGWNNGPISDSDARGARVSGLGSVGGLVGANSNGPGDGVNTIIRSTASAAVTGTGNNVGGLVGWNNGPISESHARGSVQGLHQSGGLVGWNSSSITDSSASGDVGDAASLGQSFGGLVGQNKGGMIRGSSATGDVTSTKSDIGGLVGRNEGTITESAASGAVTGEQAVGGLVGYDRGVSSGDSISASRASGNVTGSDERVGGLVGQSDGTIRASYATGAVTGPQRVGGLVGRLVGAIIAAYASGNVSGSGNAVGGLVGQSDSGNSFTATASSVLASYATGSVSGGATNLGGLIGLAQTPTGARPSPSFTDSYWDTERSGRSVGVGSDDEDADGSIGGSETATSGVTGQTTSALQTPTGYTGIYADWNIDNGDPWDFGGGTDDPELSAPPNDPPAFSSTAVQLSVAEDAAVGSAVGAAVTATDSDGDTLTYMLVGAGGVAFDIVSATGQLQVGAVLDHETDGSYTVTVQASDGKSVAFKDVTVTVTGVDEPPALSGDDAPIVAEDGGTFVSTYAVTDPEGDAVGAVTWSLAGADSKYFTIEDGRLRFRATPDYEDPNHAAGYAVTVQAAVAGQQGGPLTLAVTVNVVNVDDAGVVSLSAAQPEEGAALTATLSDPDGGVSGVTWQWARVASTNGAWTDISGATSDTYKPASGDAGHYLRATASYDDAEGSGKRARGVSDNPLAAVTAVTLSPTSLTIAEGGTNTYAVALNTQPTGDVMVDIGSDNTDVTVSSSSLTFTTLNWSAEQTVTVTAGQDADAADDAATLTHDPSGADYDFVSNAELAVTITDNDTRGVTVSPASLTIDEGGTDTYTVVLDTQPTGDVMVDIGSDNTDVTVSSSSLTFTTLNWIAEQTVTVTAGQDADAADDTATVTHDPRGADYNSVSNADLAVTVTDDETAGVTVTPTSLTIGEGGSGTYTVVLDTQPTGDVTVTIVDPTDNTDVKAEPAALTFTTTNWNSAQTVTVSAVLDVDTDDDTATVTHTVSGYGSVSSAASVTVTVAEDPTAPYDTNENSRIDKDEASVSVRGYLSDGTPSKAVASAVVRRYLSGE